MSLVVFDIIVKKHPNATPPDYSKEYKTQKTVDAKTEEWKNGGWRQDPVSCVIETFQVADPTNPEKDIELPCTENSVIQFVKHVVDEGDAVVSDDITQKTCILANTLNAMITNLKTVKNPTEDDAAVIADLEEALAKLYSFKLIYIQNNFVYGNCHNLAKTLKWDGLGGTMPQTMLGLSEKATRLAVLRTLALRCGIVG